ncbi:hypothetical protein MTP99_010366 [Tenebrio molitor]|nr:hypothetical protein MTP99_010366 [Tenebrio molitor]
MFVFVKARLSPGLVSGGKHPTSARVVHGLIEPRLFFGCWLLVTDAQSGLGKSGAFRGKADGLFRIGSFTICTEFRG